MSRQFVYQFQADGERFEYTVDLESETPEPDPQTLPDWTRLEFNQCEGCQWHQTDRCPVAVRLVEPAKLLGKFRSFDAVDVTVNAPERRYSKETTAQEALSSLFGLIMASSGCPTFSFLRGMAWHHLPFSSFEETFYRVVSSYLIRQHLAGETSDAQRTRDEITALYQQIKRTNLGITLRLREGAAPETDSPMNAVVILDSFGELVPLSMDENLEYLREKFLAA